MGDHGNREAEPWDLKRNIGLLNICIPEKIVSLHFKMPTIKATVLYLVRYMRDSLLSNLCATDKHSNVLMFSLYSTTIYHDKGVSDITVAIN